jgi:ferritin-like metal-binding protein YciE
MVDRREQVAREMLVNEARNLHSIQKNAKAMMLRVIDRLNNYPEAEARLRAHLSDKDNEMTRLEQILGSLGEDRSGIKDGAMSAMGSATAMLTAGLEDDILKTSMLTYGLASYEIVAYEGMILLAQTAGLAEAVQLLETCLSEEKAMADWLHAHMAPTLERYLDLRAQPDQEAAH